MKETPEKIPEDKYKEMVLEKCEENHIWLNRMVYGIHPTDDQKIKLADQIIKKLHDKSSQIPSHEITSDNVSMREFAKLTPCLYMRVNWS